MNKTRKDNMKTKVEEEEPDKYEEYLKYEDPY